MNGIVRNEQLKQERIIKSLIFQWNDLIHPKDKKRLDKRIEHHVRCLNKLKQQQQRLAA
jgi:replication fork clamp-binding protein CrfC